MQKVRWGLLSTANINQKLIPPIRAEERGELAAVASRSQASADAYALEWGIPLAFGSYEALLASDAVDAVYIGLPNHLHAEWSIKAMQAGKHVLCEKPFVLTMDEMDAVTDAAQETGMVIMEAFMYRHHPQTKIVGEMVRNGRLGDIRVVRGAFSFKLTDMQNVRMVPEWGGGCLWDVGCYPLSFAQYVMGSAPEWVMGDQFVNESGVDVVFNGMLHYSGNRIAQITGSFAAPFHTSIEIWGTEGRLELTRPFIGQNGPERKLLFYPLDSAAEEIVVPEKELYLGEIEDMHAAILEGKPTYLTLAETRNHMRTLLALYESAANGEVVEL